MGLEMCKVLYINDLQSSILLSPFYMETEGQIGIDKGESCGIQTQICLALGPGFFSGPVQHEEENRERTAFPRLHCQHRHVHT